MVGKLITKIVHISDTHGYHNELSLGIGDFLIHSGDAEITDFDSMMNFITWLSKQDFKIKIFVPGNHDTYIEAKKHDAEDVFSDYGIQLLIDKSYYYHDGDEQWHFYGMPHSPKYGNWSFMGDSSYMKERCREIPMDIDILITHGPPKFMLDQNMHNFYCGCDNLLQKVNQVQPILHCFGHIHEGRGYKKYGKTTYVNSAVAGGYYRTHGFPKMITLENRNVVDIELLED